LKLVACPSEAAGRAAWPSVAAPLTLETIMQGIVVVVSLMHWYFIAHRTDLLDATIQYGDWHTGHARN
jgi:hypothetical protein